MPRRPMQSPRTVAAVLLGLAIAAGCGPTTTASSSPDQSVGSSVEPVPTAAASASTSPGPITSPTAAASATASALGSERLNLLLIGTDNTAEREPSELTDSMIVASLDPVGGTVSLLGLPRDLSDFPLPDGGTYREKLNSLFFAIRDNPARYGGTADEDPYAILTRVVGGVVDLPIEHWAVIDMDGFAGMVDALGGLDVYVEEGICDAGYRQLGLRGFQAAPGWWHMTGPQALAYARVRKDAGGSDFKRMRRQQHLLVAVREAIVAQGAQSDPLGWLARIPQIRTDLPPEMIVAAGALVAGISPERFHSRLIQPFGRGGTEITDERGYVLSANIDEIREASRLLFTTPGSRPTTGRQDPPPAKPAEVEALPRFDGC